MVDPVCIAFDVSPGRGIRSWSRRAGRARPDDGRGDPSRAGTGWLAERLSSCTAKHEVAEIVCDGYGPSAAIANRVDEAGITVRRLDSGDYGKACGLFVDAVGENDAAASGAAGADAAIRARRRGRWLTGGRGRGRSRTSTSAAGGGDVGALVGDRERRRRGGDLLMGSPTAGCSLGWRLRAGGAGAARGHPHGLVQLDHPELVRGELAAPASTGRPIWRTGCGSRTAASS